jgi:hypothetical protein
MTDRENDNWKTRVLITGGVLGALAGLSTAYLLARAAEEKGNGPPQISTSDGIKMAIAIIGVVRGIAALGDR